MRTGHDKGKNVSEPSKTDRATPLPAARQSDRQATKDLFLRYVPPALSRHVLPLLPGTSPFGEMILQRQAIFIHVPKAAGSSIKTELYGKPLYGHRRIAEFFAYDPNKAARFFKFGFVRNPWDRLLSAHTFLMQGKGTNARDDRFAAEMLRPVGDFSDFVKALDVPRYRSAVLRYDHFRPQVDWICRPGQRDHALDFLGRFERIETDMAELRAKIGLPAQPLPHARPSRHSPFRDAYDTQTREIVAGIYAVDIALLGYAFDSDDTDVRPGS